MGIVTMRPPRLGACCAGSPTRATVVCVRSSVDPTRRRHWRLPRRALLVLGVLVPVVMVWGHNLIRYVAPAGVIVHYVHRSLYLDPPPEESIPELFDYLCALGERYAELPPSWGTYLYTQYYVDVLRGRDSGRRRQTPAEMRAQIAQEIEVYYIRVRPTPTPGDNRPARRNALLSKASAPASTAPDNSPVSALQPIRPELGALPRVR